MAKHCYDKTIKRIQKALEKWITPLGLKWFSIGICYVSSKKEIKRLDLSVAKVFPDWKYMRATIYFNLRELEGYSYKELEHVVVHELCHVLVNEMRQKNIHHEERVCESLARAFEWTRKADKKS